MRRANPSARAATPVGYNPDSYPKPGVPHGKLSEKHTLTSKIYDGMKYDYWVYASPGVDPNVPAPLMVWQDGQGLTRRAQRNPPDYSDGEPGAAGTACRRIVHVMIAPGTSPDGRAMRSIEYDTVSNRYPRFLMEESAAGGREDVQAQTGWL